MAVAQKTAGNSNPHGNPHDNQPTQAPTAPPPTAPTLNTITGTFAGLKAPAVNGIAVLSNNAVQSFTAAAAQGTPSSALPNGLQAVHLVGDLTNGVAVADTKSIYYMTGVGIAGANWNPIGTPKGMTNIVAMCGDLVNGLVITDGVNLFAWTFSGSSANEWVPLAQLPVAMTVRDMAGDPTNGVLLALGAASGPSSLYFGGAGCACSWVPVTSAGTSLPSARVAVQMVCGSFANGFVLYGENQMFTLGSMKYSAGSSSSAGSCTATVAKIGCMPPFTITDMTGDPTNGITARGGSTLIATTIVPCATWTLVNAVVPPATSPKQGQSAPVNLGGHVPAAQMEPEALPEAA